MKHHILIFLLSFISLPLAMISQTEKGWMLVGGTAGFNYYDRGDNALRIDIRPDHAYFVKDNFALGANLSIAVTLSEGEGTWDYGVTPLARYYFTQSPANPFVEGRFGISGISDADGNTNTRYNAGATFGIAYFITKSVAVELGLNYNHLWTGFEEEDSDWNDITLGFGFQIHLDRYKPKILEERN